MKCRLRSGHRLRRRRLSSLKLTSLAIALAVGSSAALLGACGTISDTYNDVMHSSEESLRTPTGYYEHTDAQEYADPLRIPNGLTSPYTDNKLVVPQVQPTNASRALVGANMDVRPPVVPQVSEQGVDIVSDGLNAIVWFRPYSAFAVRTDTDGWNFLNSSLNYLRIPVAQRDTEHYALATGSLSYNYAGEPYDQIAEESGARRYNQTYNIQVGHSAQGQIGYVISLASSSTADSSGDSIDSNLTPMQRANFTIGFGNTLIRALALQAQQAEQVPDNINVMLGRDNNQQEAFLVTAPYNATWSVMSGLLEQYGFEITEYSVSRSLFKVKLTEDDPQFYRNLGIEPFKLDADNYMVRLAISGKNTVLTFYNKDDKPLRTTQVTGLYQGLSQALAKEFRAYKQDPKGYAARFTKE